MVAAPTSSRTAATDENANMATILQAKFLYSTFFSGGISPQTSTPRPLRNARPAGLRPLRPFLEICACREPWFYLPPALQQDPGVVEKHHRNRSTWDPASRNAPTPYT